jgi:hypothetical protein
MYCRKKLLTNNRCTFQVSDLKHQGYCSEHWELYQLGVEYHDPMNDFDYEDNEVNELIEDLEYSQFYTNLDTNKVSNTIKHLDIKNLGTFSNDKQNVHTTPMVERTLKIANELIYLGKKKNNPNCLVEFLSSVNLSSKAMDNLLEHYYSDSSIYELETPSFKLVFDGLWNYIQNEKKDIRKELTAISKQELEDNVETCNQGNLSRIVNVLSGYIDIKNSYNPIEESLQDSMANIAKEKNMKKRKEKALEVLRKRNVKGEEKDAWLEAILEN